MDDFAHAVGDVPEGSAGPTGQPGSGDPADCRSDRRWGGPFGVLRGSWGSRSGARGASTDVDVDVDAAESTPGVESAPRPPGGPQADHRGVAPRLRRPATRDTVSAGPVRDVGASVTNAHGRGVASRAQAVVATAGDLARRGLHRLRPTVGAPPLDARGEPVPLRVDARPTAALLDADDAAASRRWAQAAGLPASGGAAAWAAVGALAALALVDDRTTIRAATRILPPAVVDRSGPASPLARWSTLLGYDVISVPADSRVDPRGSDVAGGSDASDASGGHENPVPGSVVPTPPAGSGGSARGARPPREQARRFGLEGADVAPGSVDLFTRLHPGGCAPAELDAALVEAAWALAPSGVAVVTVPLVSGGRQPYGPAEVQATIARAGEFGLRLVGRLDAEAVRRMRAAQDATSTGMVSTGDDAGRCGHAQARAYGLLRLAFRPAA